MFGIASVLAGRSLLAPRFFCCIIFLSLDFLHKCVTLFAWIEIQGGWGRLYAAGIRNPVLKDTAIG